MREIVFVLWPQDEEAAAELRAEVATFIAEGLLRPVENLTPRDLEGDE